MRLLKIAALLMAATVPTILSAHAVGESRSEPGNNVPAISPVDRRFLTQLVRRTVKARIASDEPYEPDYIPPSLVFVESQIVVTLRQDGYVRGIGVSARRPVAEACMEAARLACAGMGRGYNVDAALLDKLRIEIQAPGPPTPYTADRPWTEPGALEGFIDPGLDGVGIILDDEQHWFTPGEMISKNLSLREALRTLAKESSLDPTSLSGGLLYRFRTLHWCEVDESGQVATLRRGMVALPAEAVSAASLDDVVDRLGRYLMYRQRPGGRFAYEYSPAADLYSDTDSEVAQSGATWALAWYAARNGSEAAKSSADCAVRARLEHLVDLPHIAGASFIAAPDSRNKLGITAQLCLALVDGPDPSRYARQRSRLVKGMLWLQRPSGKLVTAFPPTQVLDTQDRFPGQALLALARCYEEEPTGEVLEAVDRAFGFYAPYFAQTGSPAMVPWHTQAFALVAQMTKKRRYTDFVFQMADQVCDHQLTPRNCASPELWGAVTATNMRPGASTAAFVAGLADAAALARRVGDAQRRHRYVEACKLGARFVMQLQFKPEECYYVRSALDTVDGIRSSPADSRLCLDSCQHALIALTKARKLLFPDKP